MTASDLRTLLSLLLTGLAHLLWVANGWAPALLAALLVPLWSLWLWRRLRTTPDAAHRFGVDGRGTLETLRALVIPTGLVTAALFAIGCWNGTVLPASFAMTLVLYPVWGVIQQLLVQGLLTDTLDRTLPRPVAVVLSAVCFGALHLAHVELVVATTAMGLVFAALFLRYRDIWGLGLVHGLLGTLFYPFVLGMDPLRDIYWPG